MLKLSTKNTTEPGGQVAVDTHLQRLVVGGANETPYFCLAEPDTPAIVEAASVGHGHPLWAPRDKGSWNSELTSNVRSILAALPDPAPVYSQWWYSRRTYPLLTHLLSTLNLSGTEVAFLACPTIAALYSQVSSASVTVLARTSAAGA